MRRRTIVKGVALLAVTGGLAAGGTALASGGGDGGSATGPDAAHAEEAALAHVGGGTANAVERDSENGATWEVEVTKTDGATVDVRLDASYAVVAVESDSESEQSGADEASGHADAPDSAGDHEAEGGE